jgi:hypothetical protein
MFALSQANPVQQSVVSVQAPVELTQHTPLLQPAAELQQSLPAAQPP